uniref:Uncharacterized protein n=1 Tax=Molossus molossus TaxID=27622 RepID=A0A7J8FS12_MOLMO|nr:hypothetical protein HJG59_008330 [Molossus molossus]
MIKGSIHQKYNKGKYICISTRAAKCKKQVKTDLKGEIYNNPIIVVEFNASLSTTDRSTGEKINKEIFNFKCTLDQIDLTNIHRTFHPEQQNTFFSSTPRASFRIDHMLGHETSLSKFQYTDIIPSISSNQMV